MDQDHNRWTLPATLQPRGSVGLPVTPVTGEVLTQRNTPAVWTGV
jgi:hypothetical protein